MKDYQVPIELEQELERLKKKDKMYTYVLMVLIAFVAVIGIKLYLQSTEGNNPQTLYGTQTGAPMSNSSGQTTALPGGTGGGCGGGSGGCGSGNSGGGCGSAGGGSQVVAPELEEQVLDMYKAEFGNIVGMSAKVLDLGCHQEINIIDEDKNLVKRYQLRGGQISVLAQ
jgi:hypothetical protein